MYLIRHLGFKSAPEVLDLVCRYYPANRIPVKAQYLIESLFDKAKYETENIGRSCATRA